VARLSVATEVIICTTEAAQQKHGAGIALAFEQSGLCVPRFLRIRDGKTPAELWDNFDNLTSLLTEGDVDQVLLDITHGFRSQPFFAGAVVSFVRALSSEARRVEVVYGAFEARSQANRTPIWSLTQFADLVDWTHDIRRFVTTGDARDMARRAESIGRADAKQWAAGGRQGPEPRLKAFARALSRFSDALVTVRTGELLLSKPRESSAAIALAEASSLVLAEVEAAVPPLAKVLGDVKAMAESLCIDEKHLAGSVGRKAMAALARLYWRLGRYAEAGIALREGWISLGAAPQAAMPGHVDYDKVARERAENDWRSQHGQQARRISRIRNDIEHGGFSKNPSVATTIVAELDTLIADLELDGQDPPREPAAGTSYFVTRHPGAVEWAATQGFRIDVTVSHLDPGEVHAGDVVIGTLPLNLAADVCDRGARFFNLSLNLLPQLRGRELSVDELVQCGAKLEEFRIERIGGASAESAWQRKGEQ
jgi:CRISPR-associated protein Csx16